MPLYEYKCGACGHRFELLQRMGANFESLECPRCGERSAEKQFSTFAATSSGSSSRSASPAGPPCGGGGCGAGAGFT